MPHYECVADGHLATSTRPGLIFIQTGGVNIAESFFGAASRQNACSSPAKQQGILPERISWDYIEMFFVLQQQKTSLMFG